MHLAKAIRDCHRRLSRRRLSRRDTAEIQPRYSRDTATAGSLIGGSLVAISFVSRKGVMYYRLGEPSAAAPYFEAALKA